MEYVVYRYMTMSAPGGLFAAPLGTLTSGALPGVHVLEYFSDRSSALAFLKARGGF